MWMSAPVSACRRRVIVGAYLCRKRLCPLLGPEMSQKQKQDRQPYLQQFSLKDWPGALLLRLNRHSRCTTHGGGGTVYEEFDILMGVEKDSTLLIVLTRSQRRTPGDRDQGMLSPKLGNTEHRFPYHPLKAPELHFKTEMTCSCTVSYPLTPGPIPAHFCLCLCLCLC